MEQNKKTKCICNKNGVVYSQLCLCSCHIDPLPQTEEVEENELINIAKDGYCICAKCGKEIGFNSHMCESVQAETVGWERYRQTIVEKIHNLVGSEVSRVHEESNGAIRRDGGRLMNEESVIKSIIEMIIEMRLLAQSELYEAILAKETRFGDGIEREFVWTEDIETIAKNKGII